MSPTSNSKTELFIDPKGSEGETTSVQDFKAESLDPLYTFVGILGIIEKETKDLRGREEMISDHERRMQMETEVFLSHLAHFIRANNRFEQELGSCEENYKKRMARVVQSAQMLRKMVSETEVLKEMTGVENLPHNIKTHSDPLLQETLDSRNFLVSIQNKISRLRKQSSDSVRPIPNIKLLREDAIKKLAELESKLAKLVNSQALN